MRFVLALILVLATVIIVVVGVIQQMDPQDLHQYLSPITGLTGAAVGYWFGAKED
jgi:hypothetical protein